jgi:exopolysaccharide production protein ExoQ
MALPALAFCLLFIAWLLWRECHRRPSVSAALWIPTFLLLILGSRPVSMWLGGSFAGGNDAERSPLEQFFYLSVLVGSFIVASSRGVKWGRLFATNPALMLFYVYFALSVFWSGDPVGSSKRLFKDFGLLFVISVILSEKHPLEAIRAVYVRCACVLFPLSVVCIRYFPNIARGFSIEGQPEYTGVTTQKNTLGEIILVFSLFLVWDCLEIRSARSKQLSSRIPWDRLVLLLMGVWLLDMAQSKTALICLLIGVALIVRNGWLASRLINRTVLIGALSVPYLMFFAQRFSSLIAPVVEALGRNMTFTGRADIWQHITAQTVDPLVGAGYWNFWGGKGGLAISQAMQTTVPNAHCGYLDIYLDGGVIGLALLFFLLVARGKRLIANQHGNRFQQVRFAVVIVMIFYNLSESMFARLSLLWFTTLLVLIDFPTLKAAVTKTRMPAPGANKNIKLSTTELPQWANQ